MVDSHRATLNSDRSVLYQRHRARPSSRGSLYQHGKADDGETTVGECLQVVELLKLAVAVLAARLVTLPDDRRIAVTGEALRPWH